MAWNVDSDSVLLLLKRKHYQPTSFHLHIELNYCKLFLYFRFSINDTLNTIHRRINELSISLNEHNKINQNLVNKGNQLDPAQLGSTYKNKTSQTN
jgi:hypothetical protein